MKKKKKSKKTTQASLIKKLETQMDRLEYAIGLVMSGFYPSSESIELKNRMNQKFLEKCDAARKN